MIACADVLAPLQPPTAALQIAVLGPPDMRWLGRSLTLPRRQSRALLYRIAAAPQPVARDHVCFLLWPDSTDAVARRNLTVLLSHLRRALPIPETLVLIDDAITLDRAGAWVDATAVAEAMTTAVRTRQTASLSSVVELYRGPFLDGFTLADSPEWEDWVTQERQSWERRYLQALAALIEDHTANSAYGAAITSAQRYLATDELAEEIHRALIGLYAATGDRTAALRQFERCVVVLDRELGVSPLPQTHAVYQAVRDGQLPLPARPLDAPTRMVVVSAPPTAAQPVADEVSTAAALLPTPPNPLIGRAAEVADCTRMLGGDVRLLTLAGPGGSGKTRLALQAAWDLRDSFADGVVWVPLAPLHDPERVIDAIMQACGVQQAGATPPLDLLRAKLAPQQRLLVLDNFEHLLAAAPLIAEILAWSSRLSVLVTSRTVLNLQGEHAIAVLPLPLPDLARLPPLQELAEQPAVALLLARTRAHTPAFQLTRHNAAELATICVHLDGLPLAIELAAARLKILSPGALLKRLNHRLALLDHGSRDLPARQRTLRALIEWSYRLLDLSAQRLFEHLAVFGSSWTLAATEAVCCGDGLPHNVLDGMQALLDANLVTYNSEADAEPRFGMLQTIREYALEQLQQRGALPVAAQAHADYYLALVEPLEVNDSAWLTIIERDLDNLRAALRWQLDQPAGSETALRLGAVLGRFWYWRDQMTEGRWWLQLLLERSADVRTPARTEVMGWAALFATVVGDTAQAITLRKASAQLGQELQLLRPQVGALISLGTIYCRQGDFPQAIAALEEALELARQLGTPDTLSNAYYMLAGVLVDAGNDIERALALYEECLAIVREHKLVLIESMTLAALGVALLLTGNIQRAAELLPEALRIQRAMNATMAIGWTLQSLGILAYQQGHYVTAQQYLIESLGTTAHGGAQYIVPASLECLAGVASAVGQPHRAARLLGAAEALREAINLSLPPIEQAYYHRILGTVRDQLAAPALVAAWQAGRQLTSAQAIAEATAESVTAAA